MNWLLGLWYWQTRRLDIRILWPQIKAEAVRRRQEGEELAGYHWLDAARDAFKFHAMRDAGWLWLGPVEMERRINRLQ
jgi:hypothetical protein